MKKRYKDDKGNNTTRARGTVLCKMMAEDGMLTIRTILPIVMIAYEELRRTNMSPEDARNFILSMLDLEPLSDANKKRAREMLKLCNLQK
jgi:hypothetical protein